MKAKSDVLNGLTNDDLAVVAKPSLYNRVKEERQKDFILGEKQIINASIISINIAERSERRIVADVELNYKDKRVSASGNISSETVIPSLKVKYVIGKNKNIWQLVDYISGS